MKLFHRIGRGLSGLVGGVDAEVMRVGLAARAVVEEVVPTGTVVQLGGGLDERVCEFVVAVSVGDAPAYRARVRQRAPEFFLARARSKEPVAVAARVHPLEPQRVALDFDAPVVDRCGRRTRAAA
jgi:hypothetical protein